MTPNLLILGGTTEASALASHIAGLGMKATLSFAGRVSTVKPQPLPTRIGGFGGVAGLKDYLTANTISHVVDATHPFAAQMSQNAISACNAANTPLVALTRAPWYAEAGDTWTEVADIAEAVSALDAKAKHVFLAVGRMHLAEFAPNPQHSYLLRLVDPPEGELPLPDAHVIVDRGPFDFDGDLALLTTHGIEVVVSKNAGGTGAQAKILAARALGLPVIMIKRPSLPPRPEVHSVSEVMVWLGRHGCDLT